MDMTKKFASHVTPFGTTRVRLYRMKATPWSAAENDVFVYMNKCSIWGGCDKREQFAEGESASWEIGSENIDGVLETLKTLGYSEPSKEELMRLHLDGK